MSDKLLTFKRDSAFNLMERIFSVGIAPLLFPAFWLGRYFAILFPADYQVPAETPGFVTFTSGPNIMLGILVGAGVLVISILIWKVICQSLLIVLEAFETYTNRHSKED
ncbi:hypothetical protein [Clostridium formicaceticum]|uniref:Uncharacterized protein n=1 Tax=Clostridium formicaceticum TaxID=1497 RepID=A0AAC9WFW8_9CLOT|nr:hypothetical protein [Clostridium formicaceticum]AOY76789.1 hypothetical protein BJL90_13560 [Clostridium formicaceticum]ARE87253.1 hypothetical protein CLFO_16520 [Clostridium formicaceticum]